MLTSPPIFFLVKNSVNRFVSGFITVQNYNKSKGAKVKEINLFNMFLLRIRKQTKKNAGESLFAHYPEDFLRVVYTHA